MKGVVVDRKKRYAIVMTAEGGFYKTKIDSSHTIGEEVQFTPVKEQSGLWSILRSYGASPQLKAATAILLCLAIIYPLLSWTDGSSETYAYVNIDINPSLSFEVDDSYQIINAQGLNEDGSKLLAELGDLQGESLQDISFSIVSLSQEKGYLDVDRNILLGVNYASSQSNNNDTYLESLSNDLTTKFNQNYQFAWFEVPDEIREKAKQAGTSMNILFASNQLLNQSSNNSNQDSNQTESSDSENMNNDQDQSNDQTNNQSNEDRSSDNQDSNQKDSLNEKFKKFFERMNPDELPSDLRDKFSDSQSEENEQVNQSNSTQNKDNQSSDQDTEKQEKDNASNKSDDHPVFGEDGPPGQNKNKNKNKNKSQNNQQSSNQSKQKQQSNNQESNEDRKKQEQEDDSNESDDHPVFGEDGPPGQNKNKNKNKSQSKTKKQSPKNPDRESEKDTSEQKDSQKESDHPVFGEDGPPGQQKNKNK